MARARKLEKDVNYETGVVTLTVLSNGKQIVADTNAYPDDIKSKLIPLAVSHRLGDAAAGKDGDEAAEAIQKVQDGLMAGNFTIRVAAASKGIKKSDIKAKLEGLSKKEKDAAAALLATLGIEL